MHSNSHSNTLSNTVVTYGFAAYYTQGYGCASQRFNSKFIASAKPLLPLLTTDRAALYPSCHLLRTSILRRLRCKSFSCLSPNLKLSTKSREGVGPQSPTSPAAHSGVFKRQISRQITPLTRALLAPLRRSASNALVGGSPPPVGLKCHPALCFSCMYRVNAHLRSGPHPAPPTRCTCGNGSRLGCP